MRLLENSDYNCKTLGQYNGIRRWNVLYFTKKVLYFSAYNIMKKERLLLKCLDNLDHVNSIIRKRNTLNEAVPYPLP